MFYDAIIIGGGPAGLAAALEASKRGLAVLLLEREDRTGGILKQCIHDGFGIVRFREKLSGPEYAHRFSAGLEAAGAEVRTFTFVSDIQECDGGFLVTASDASGMHEFRGRNIVLATGCRERTRNQILLPGTRPAGVYTAGTAQYLVNRLGLLPGKRVVILGSGDIGLIMARRLTLEGAEVIGVYEIKNTPSGLPRNIAQCLLDFNIPLHLCSTVTEIHGKKRIEAVTVSKVDAAGRKIPGTEERIPCDALILAVGLIPENELGEKLGLRIDPKTKGPEVDQRMMASIPGVFAVGNSLHVNDLVDYVSESAEIAARALSREYSERKILKIDLDPKFMYVVPQMLDLNAGLDELIFYFRSNAIYENPRLVVSVDGVDVWSRKNMILQPPLMERIKLSFGKFGLNENSKISFRIEVGS